MKEHTCTTYIVKSNLGFKESWVIQSNQDVHVWMYGIYMVANLILLCSLKTYHSFETWKHLLDNRGYLILLFFFFLGRHLSTHCFKYLGHLSIFFQLLFFLLLIFMNNFCIAPISLFYNKTLREISIRTWSIYLVDGKSNKHVFGSLPV